MAKIPKNLQLGTEMTANPEMLGKWILADPQRDLTTTGIGENFYCLCVQTMGQKWEIMGNIAVPDFRKEQDKGDEKNFLKKYFYIYI